MIIFAQLDLTDMVVLPNKKHDGRYFGVLPTKNVGDLSWQKSLDLAKKGGSGRNKFDVLGTEFSFSARLWLATATRNWKIS